MSAADWRRYQRKRINKRANELKPKIPIYFHRDFWRLLDELRRGRF